MILPVFVYGTLRPGEAGFMELQLAEKTDYLGPAQVSGSLYDLGEYPGAALDDAGLIRGDLLRPRDETVLAELDAYELYDPANPAGSEYVRVTALTYDKALSVWIYVYNFSLRHARPIPGGDWLERSRP